MTDREMIELAAKAAGIDIEMTPAGVPWLASGKRPWNPLTDDGDALRLAVRGKIDLIQTNLDGPKVHAISGGGPILFPTQTEDSSADPYAATRRAITRAAAEIGRAMKEAALRREEKA